MTLIGILGILSLVWTGPGGFAAAAARGEPFDPVSSLYEKGNEYFRRGSYSSAISVFQLVSDNHPEHPLAPEALFSIASAKHKMSDLDSARSTFEDLLKKYPTASAIPDALLQLGTIYSELGDAAGAKKIWNRLAAEYKGSIAAKIAEQRLPNVDVAATTTPLAPARPVVTPAPEGPDISKKSITQYLAPAVPAVTASPAPAVPPAVEMPEPEPKSVAVIPSLPDVYVVKKGDSISKIAKAILGSTDRYKELAKYNKIPPPYTVSVGQELKIPGGRMAGGDIAAAFGAGPSMAGGHTPVPPKVSPSLPPARKEKPSETWDPMPSEDMTKAADSIHKWVDNRSEGYESLQSRLLELQRDVRGQKVLEKQLELMKSQLDGEQTQNAQLKKELIEHMERLKEMKDRNTGLLTQVEGLTDSAERSKVMQARAAEMDAQMRAHRQRMETLEKQNQTLSETLQKMRDAFDAQISLVKAYYDSQLAQARQEYESRLDTTTLELFRLREETRKKDASLNELKRDYADLMKKAASIQKEAIEEKQSRVSVTAAKQSLEKAQDLRRAGKIPEAEAAYKEALSVYPESADAMNGLAYLYAEEKRNLDDAEKLIERAIALDPQGRGYYLDTLGWIHFVRTAYAAALDALHEAHRRIPIEDLPARAAVHFHIGKVYQALSDKDKAFFHFIDAIKLAPRTRWASLSERELDTL